MENISLLIYSLVIILIIASICCGIIFYIQKKINTSLEKSNSYSEIKINIKEKNVYITNKFFNKEKDNNIYSLEDFIYMISLNPDSKSFREFLKLINNNSKIEILKEKLVTLENNIPFFIKYPFHGKKLCIAQINSQNTDIKINFTFQILEMNLEKKNLDVNFLNEKIIYYNDYKIYNEIIKEVKKEKEKWWNLIIISPPKKEFLSQKFFLSNQLDLLKIKSILLKMNMTSWISSTGSLYIIVNLRKKNSIFLLSGQNKLQYIMGISNKEYNNFGFDNYVISTISFSKKDTDDINIAIIKSNLYLEYGNDYKFSKSLLLEIENKAIKINENSKFIIYQLKNNNSFIKKIELKIKNEKFIEYYLDLSSDIFSDCLKYSFKHQKELSNLFIDKLYYFSSQNKENTIFTTLNLNDISVINNYLIKPNSNNNFFIEISSKENIYENIIWLNSLKNFKDKNFYTIKIIDSFTRDTFNFIKRTKPYYLILSKNFKNDNIFIPKDIIIYTKKYKIKLLNLI